MPREERKLRMPSWRGRPVDIFEVVSFDIEGLNVQIFDRPRRFWVKAYSMPLGVCGTVVVIIAPS
jgi:hypothetical protein